MPRARKGIDGRVNSGGSRTGTPGKAYANRTDLTSGAIQTAKGQEYGKAKAQQDSMKAVPVAGGATTVAPAGPVAMPPGFVYPEDTPTFGQPSSRPDEPITAGLPFGPGVGPTRPAPNPNGEDIVDRLRALYLQFPTDELRDLLDQADFQ